MTRAAPENYCTAHKIGMMIKIQEKKKDDLFIIAVLMNVWEKQTKQNSKHTPICMDKRSIIQKGFSYG